MKSKTIRVRAAEGRVVVFPQGTVAGPGRTNLRLAGSEDVALEGAITGEMEVAFDAFVRGRLRAGDLVEVGGATAADPSKDMRAPATPNLSAAKKE
jgi:hypothetical protein